MTSNHQVLGSSPSTRTIFEGFVMDAVEKIKQRIKEDQAVVNEFNKLEQQLTTKDDIIKSLQNRITQLEDKLYQQQERLVYERENIAGDINRDAKLIADGEKHMPDGYYRETIKKPADFSYCHKKQA